MVTQKIKILFFEVRFSFNKQLSQLKLLSFKNYKIKFSEITSEFTIQKKRFLNLKKRSRLIMNMGFLVKSNKRKTMRQVCRSGS